MPVYSHPYDNRNYDPAMPVVQIELFSKARGQSTLNLVGLIDSGADATLLPLDALESIGARFARSRQMRGVAGSSIPVDTYHVVLSLGPYFIHGIEAVATPVGSEAIIGRDVLNQLEVVLNGPAQELWVA